MVRNHGKLAKIGIVIPAHNEEFRIERTLEKYGFFFDKLVRNNKIGKFKILVVLNACSDNTLGIVEKIHKRFPEIRSIEFERGGKGFAVKEGFKKLVKEEFDYIGFVDADMATPPEAFYWLLEKSVKENLDGAIADRTNKNSIIIPRFTFRRFIVSRVFNYYIRTLFLFKYKDTQCGAKIFKKNAVEKVIGKLGMTYWAFDVELLYLLNKEKFRILGCETIWKDVDKSKLKVGRATIQMIMATMQLRIIKSPFYRILRPLKLIRGIMWRILK